MKREPGASKRKSDVDGHHLGRVRRICGTMPESTERLSHGEPTFFVRRKVFAMFSNNHHRDGHIAVLLPAPPGFQAAMIQQAPDKYYRPPYVGGAGWIGIELNQISDEELAAHIRAAWRLIAPKKLQAEAGSRPRPSSKAGRQPSGE